MTAKMRERRGLFAYMREERVKLETSIKTVVSNGMNMVNFGPILSLPQGS